MREINKFQKAAWQCAKDDKKKGFNAEADKIAKFYKWLFKRKCFTYDIVLDFKNWNKEFL